MAVKRPVPVRPSEPRPEMAKLPEKVSPVEEVASFPGEAVFEPMAREEFAEVLHAEPELSPIDQLINRIYPRALPSISEIPVRPSEPREIPTMDFDTILEFAVEDPENFIIDLQKKGRSEDTEMLLELMGATPEDIDMLLPEIQQPIVISQTEATKKRTFNSDEMLGTWRTWEGITYPPGVKVPVTFWEDPGEWWEQYREEAGERHDVTRDAAAIRRATTAEMPGVVGLVSSPTWEGGLSVSDIAGIGLLAYASYQGARVGWDMFLRSSLIRNLNSWTKSVGVVLDPKTKTNFVNMAMANLSKKWLSQQAIRTLFKPTKAGLRATAETVRTAEHEINALVQRTAGSIIPKGTQTGAMAFGGLPDKGLPPAVISAIELLSKQRNDLLVRERRGADVTAEILEVDSKIAELRGEPPIEDRAPTTEPGVTPAVTPPAEVVPVSEIAERISNVQEQLSTILNNIETQNLSGEQLSRFLEEQVISIAAFDPTIRVYRGIREGKRLIVPEDLAELGVGKFWGVSRQQAEQFAGDGGEVFAIDVKLSELINPELIPTDPSLKELNDLILGTSLQARAISIPPLQPAPILPEPAVTAVKPVITKADFIEQNADLVVKEKGRWGTIHFALKTRTRDYQRVGEITSDSAKGVLEQFYDKLAGEGQLPTVAPPPEPVIPQAPEVPTALTVVGEGGVIVPPTEPIPTSIVNRIPVYKDVGWKEGGRVARKVFERLDLYTTFRGIQKAEVLVGEAKIATQKTVKSLFKPIDNDRKYLVFREVNEPGSQKGLTVSEKRAVTWTKNFYDKWADKKGIPQEKRVKNYITHLFEEEMIAQLKETGMLSPELANILSSKVSTKINDPFLKERLGAVGFQEDPVTAILTYDAVANRVLYYEPHLQKIAAIANDPETPRATRDYLKDYSRRMTGEPSKIDKKINADLLEMANKLKKLPGGDELVQFLEHGNPSGLASYQLASAYYGLWLGFKGTSAIRNLGQHTLIIGDVGPVRFAQGIGLRFTTEGRAALKESWVWRSRSAAFVPGIDDSFAAQWTDQFRETALYLFRKADEQNVKDAFLAGYAEAKDILTQLNAALPADRRLSPEELHRLIIDRGDEVAADTQYLYTKMNSMAVSQSAPGRVLSVLTTWSANWLELMNKWISRRPSQVYLEFERLTGPKTLEFKRLAGAEGEKVVYGYDKPRNWALTYRAIGIYIAIVGLGFAIKERTRLKAWEYTGITSIRYLANVVSGDFPGLQAPGAIAKLAAGLVTDDDRMFNEGWRDFKSTFTPGIVKQLQSWASGDKDWLTLLFYLEGKDWKLKKLKDGWKKDLAPYNDLPTDKRTAYREGNPKIEAKLFVSGQISTLSSDAARAEVLRIIEEHNLDPDLVRGYQKLFGGDVKAEIDGFRKRVGNLEKLEIGEEAEYFTVANLLTEINKAVKTQGRPMVEKNADMFITELLRAQDSFVQYDNLDSEGKKKFRQQFPDVEAWLYMTGRISAFDNPNSAVELLSLMDKYDIPMESIKAFIDNPEKYDELQTPLFQLKLKVYSKDRTFDSLPDKPLIEMGKADEAVGEIPAENYVAWKTYRAMVGNTQPEAGSVALAIEKIQGASNTHVTDSDWDKEWRGHYDDIIDRLREIQSGKHWAPRLSSALQILYYDIKLDKQSADSYRASGDHEKADIYERAYTTFSNVATILARALPRTVYWKNVSTGEVAIGLDAFFKAHPELTKDFRAEFEIDNPKWVKDNLRIEAFGKDIPETLHDDYVGYYTIPSAGYDNERFLMEHDAFYRHMVDSGIWKEKSFDKVPTVMYEETLVEYEKLELGKARYEFRGNDLEFDAEGARIGRWKPFDQSRLKAEEPEKKIKLPEPPVPPKTGVKLPEIIPELR